MLRGATAFATDNNRGKEVKVTFRREKFWNIETFQDIHVLSVAVVEKIPDTKSTGISTKAPLTFLPGSFRASVRQNFDVHTETHE